MSLRQPELIEHHEFWSERSTSRWKTTNPKFITSDGFTRFLLPRLLRGNWETHSWAQDALEGIECKGDAQDEIQECHLKRRLIQMKNGDIKRLSTTEKVSSEERTD